MITNELRIGNWVNSELFWDYKIVGISNFSENNALFWESYDYYPKACSIDSLKGIHLTEEWMVKAGFNYNMILRVFTIPRHIDFVVISYVDTDKSFMLFFNCKSIKIEYVHQLQNLYFALTGEELQL